MRKQLFKIDGGRRSIPDPGGSLVDGGKLTDKTDGGRIDTTDGGR